jgi:hypothetical protein
VLTIAGIIAYVEGVKRRVLHGVLYLCTLLYPAIYAASIFLYSVDQIGGEGGLNSNWPTTFLPHATWVLGDPMTIALLIVGTVTAVMFLKEQNRKFLAIWFVAAVVLYLNPVVATPLITFVTTPNAYWRLFYLLPFPFVVGVSGVALISYLERHHPRLRITVPGLVIFVLLFVHLPKSTFHGYGSYRNTLPRPTSLGWPRYQIHDLATAQGVLDTNPPAGTILAPLEISTTIAILTSRYKHICYRIDGLRMWLDTDPEMLESTITVSQYLNRKLDGGKPSLIVDFLKLYPDINTVVIRLPKKQRARRHVRRVLRANGFTKIHIVGKMRVFSREKPHHSTAGPGPSSGLTAGG